LTGSHGHSNEILGSIVVVEFIH